MTMIKRPKKVEAMEMAMRKEWKVGTRLSATFFAPAALH